MLTSLFTFRKFKFSTLSSLIKKERKDFNDLFKLYFLSFDSNIKDLVEWPDFQGLNKEIKQNIFPHSWLPWYYCLKGLSFKEIPRDQY